MQGGGGVEEGGLGRWRGGRTVNGSADCAKAATTLDCVHGVHSAGDGAWVGQMYGEAGCLQLPE